MKDILQPPEEGKKEGEYSGSTDTSKKYVKTGTKTTKDIKVEMNKIRRRFIKFELHLDDIKQDMDDTRSTLGQIEKDIKDVDRSIQGLM